MRRNSQVDWSRPQGFGQRQTQLEPPPVRWLQADKVAVRALSQPQRSGEAAARRPRTGMVRHNGARGHRTEPPRWQESRRRGIGSR